MALTVLFSKRGDSFMEYNDGGREVAGYTVHLQFGELPMGRLVVQVSKHLTAVIDGIIHDTFDPTREGTCCVYGYWSSPK